MQTTASEKVLLVLFVLALCTLLWVKVIKPAIFGHHWQKKPGKKTKPKEEKRAYKWPSWLLVASGAVGLVVFGTILNAFVWHSQGDAEKLGKHYSDCTEQVTLGKEQKRLITAPLQVNPEPFDPNDVSHCGVKLIIVPHDHQALRIWGCGESFHYRVFHETPGNGKLVAGPDKTWEDGDNPVIIDQGETSVQVWALSSAESKHDPMVWCESLRVYK